MPIDLRLTPYGEPAAALLADVVAQAKGGDALAPVTVVVPSNHVGVASRRLLAARLGGLVAVTFVTPYRLAELLGAPALAATGRRPVSTPVLAATVRAELAHEPGLFAPVAAHPATEAALVSTYRELRDLSPAALDALSRTSARAAEVVRLHRAVRARLEPGWSDEEDLLVAAAGAVGEGSTTDLGTVVVHLPQRLSLHAGALVAAIADRVPTVVIAGLTGIESADAEVHRSLERLGVEGELRAVTPLPPRTDRTRVVTASDADEEVRAAVRTVIGAIRAGTRLDRIAVLHASPEPYARLTHEQMHAADVATNGAAVLPLAARMAGRVLLDLLQLPIGGYRRQDVFAWLAAAPIVHDGRLAPTTAWERLSREAAVVAGRMDWDAHLLQLAARYEQRAEADERDDSRPECAAARHRTSAQQARDLRDFVLGIVDDLAAAASRPRPWSEHAAWAQRQLRRLLGAAGRRERWPEAERKAADRVEQALDRLGALDRVEPTATLEVFARTLEIELQDDLGRVGRFGDGVLVGSVEMGIGLELDLVVVLGLAEGSFPATVRDDSLLPDRERRASGGELGLRADRVERQHRQLLAALAGAQHCVLLVPRGDLRRSADRLPSRWVLDLAGHLEGEGRRWWAPDLLGAEVAWVEHVPSFDAGLRRAPVPATAQEHRLRSLLAAHGDLAGTSDDLTARGYLVLSERRSPRFTRFDGNLAGEAVPSPVDRITSPTRLERWAACPHRHLVEDLLGAAPIENPEEALVMTPIQRGNLIHEVLERFLLRVLARPDDQRPRPGQPWTPDDVALIGEIAAATCDRYEALGVTGRPIFWRRDRRRILNDLDASLVLDSAHRIERRTAPHATEAGFGFDDDGLDAVSVPLPDGRTLRVRGRIDRIDLGADGSIHVTDYKTGSDYGYGGLSEDDPVLAGTKLQLPIYGLAGRSIVGGQAPVHAAYWFVTSRYEFKRVGYEITDAVLARASEVLGRIVEGIEAGVFPPHPEALSTFFRVGCQVCDPDGLGTAELRKQWERKRSDPTLAVYADLAEPSADDDEEEVVLA